LNVERFLDLAAHCNRYTNEMIIRTIIITAFAIAIMSSCNAPVSLSKPSARDADESVEVYAFIKAHFDIEPKERAGYSGYAKPGVEITTIYIYRMTSIEEQDRLIELLSQVISSKKWKPIKLLFFEKEILNYGSRGNEKLIRSAMIKSEIKRNV